MANKRSAAITKRKLRPLFEGNNAPGERATRDLVQSFKQLLRLLTNQELCITVEVGHVKMLLEHVIVCMKNEARHSN